MPPTIFLNLTYFVSIIIFCSEICHIFPRSNQCWTALPLHTLKGPGSAKNNDNHTLLQIVFIAVVFESCYKVWRIQAEPDGGEKLLGTVGACPQAPPRNCRWPGRRGACGLHRAARGWAEGVPPPRAHLSLPPEPRPPRNLSGCFFLFIAIHTQEWRSLWLIHRVEVCFLLRKVLSLPSLSIPAFSERNVYSSINTSPDSLKALCFSKRN